MKIPIVVMCLILGIILSACSNTAYNSNMKMRENSTLFKESNRRQAVEAIGGAIKTIINVVEGVVESEKHEKFIDKVTLSNGVGSNDFVIAVFGDVMVAMINAQSKAEIARARAEAIRYLEPILLAIYQDEYEKIGVPLTANDVTIKFFEQIPLVTTVAGMYGLGVAGINAATAKITGNTINESPINTGNKGNTGSTGNGRSNVGAGSTDGNTTIIKLDDGSMIIPEIPEVPESVTNVDIP